MPIIRRIGLWTMVAYAVLIVLGIIDSNYGPKPFNGEVGGTIFFGLVLVGWLVPFTVALLVLAAEGVRAAVRGGKE